MNNDTYQKKIAFAVTAPQSTGLMRGQAAYLKKHGYKVYILCPDEKVSREMTSNEGAELVPIPYSREIDLFNDIKCLYLTWKNLRRIKPDIVNVGTPKAGLLGILAASFLGLKIRIFTLRGIRSTAMPKGMKQKIVRAMEVLTHKYATNIISISPSMADYAASHGLLKMEKVKILAKASSNGINVDRFSIANKESLIVNDLRKEFGINENDFVVGYVGRVVKSKGIEELYQCFTKIKEKTKLENLKLLVVGAIETQGDAVDPSILARMQSDKDVLMVGARADVEFCYQLMNVFALPSHNFREGFGNVAMEASSSGIPIVVSNKGGCQDAVIDGVTGVLVDPFDSEQLTDAIMTYIKNPEMAVEHGRSGNEYANKYFKNVHIWSEQLAFYENLLK